MERRVLGNWHARCGTGEKLKIISKTYLSLYLVILTAVFGRIGPPHKGLLQQVGIAETVADLPLHIGNICVVHVHNPFSI